MGMIKKHRAKIIDCKAIAEKILEQTKEMMVENRIYNLNIFAPNEPDNEAYIKGINKDALKLGIGTCECSSSNWESYVHDSPYIVMYPTHRGEKYDESFDVDGRNSGSWYNSRTGMAVQEILDTMDGDYYRGQTIVVIGRGETGNGIVEIVRHWTNATIIQCNSCSDLKKYCKKADVIVSAVGAPTVDKSMVKKGAIVIDAGIRVVDGKVVGDVNENVREVDCRLTTVPNGVGLVTRACLLRAVVQATNLVAE